MSNRKPDTMQRQSFLRYFMLLIGFIATPFSLLSKGKDRNKKGFKVDAGQDRFNASISLLEGDTFYTKIATKDTDGDVFLFESTRVVNGGPPLHYHQNQDEWFYILQGEFLIKIGEETFTAKAGASAFAPRTVVHAFSKTSKEDGKMLIMFQPAGMMEMHFKGISNGAYKNLTDAEKRDLQAAHDVHVTGPALGHQK